MSAPRFLSGWLAGAGLALAVAVIGAPGIVAGADVAPDVAVKAAFLYNFAKFTDWPALPSGNAIVICTVGDDGIGMALIEMVRGQQISGHPVEVRRTEDSTRWRLCQMLFIADADAQRPAAKLDRIKQLGADARVGRAAVLTISDSQDFAESGGMIGLYVEGGRMRFAINVDTAGEAGLRLSSRLLGLAKIVRNTKPP